MRKKYRRIKKERSLETEREREERNIGKRKRERERRRERKRERRKDRDRHIKPSTTHTKLINIKHSYGIGGRSEDIRIPKGYPVGYPEDPHDIPI